MFDYRLSDTELITLRDRFEKVYVRQVPEPEGKTSRAILGALILLVIASVIVSASHTIPAFVETLEGEMSDGVKAVIAIAALVMVEVGMLVLAFVLSRRLADVDPEHITKQLKRGLRLAFVLALSANLYSTLKPTFGGQEWWSIASFFVFVLMGISAPTLAYIAGEVFGLTTLKDERDNADALAEWRAKRDEAWEVALAKYQRDMVRNTSVSRPVPQVPNVPMEFPMEGQTAGGPPIPARSSLGHTKIPDAAEKVRAYLEQNPDALEMSGLKLAQLLGVGKSTAYAVQAEMKAKRSNDAEG